MTASWWRGAALLVLLAGFLVLGRQGTGGAVEEKPGTETLPADLARVPVRALAMLSVRPADLWASPLSKGLRDKMGKEYAAEIKQLERKIGLAPTEIERMTFVMRESPDSPPLIFFSTTKTIDSKKVFMEAMPRGMEETYNGETIFTNENQAGYVLAKNAFVIGSKGDIQSLIDAGKEKGTGGLAPALALAAKKHSLVVAVNPANLSAVEDKLPAEAEPFKPLFKANLATIAIDVAEKTTGGLRVVFPGASEAGAGLEALQAGQKMALHFLGEGIKQLNNDESTKSDELTKSVVGLLEHAQKSLNSTTIKRDGNAVVAHLAMKIDQAVAGTVIAGATRKVRQATARAQSQNNLKQIVLAMHNYMDKEGRFPAQAIFDKDGKALLSWRVTLLPYLDQNELYKEFKLDEAWDSAHNKKLLARMPTVFQLPTGKPKHPHGTFYQGFVGKSAFFEGKKGMGVADITDGLSNTIMIVEAAGDVPWTKPEDVPFDPDKELPKLGGHRGAAGFFAALCDGSVRFFTPSISQTTLRAAITRNGGEVLGSDF